MITNHKIILDASALIALISKETGHDKVYSVIAHSVMSSVNISEVAKFLIDHHNVSKNAATNTIQTLISEVIPFSEDHAYSSAELVIHTRNLGLSLGDRACIALGISTGYPIYTADKAWAKLNVNCEIILIR